MIAIPPLPSPSTSSDAPIPHITPTPFARSCQEPSAFAVTSRRTSRASNPSIGMPAALDKSIKRITNQSRAVLCQLCRPAKARPTAVAATARRVTANNCACSLQCCSPESSGEEPEPLPLLWLHSRPHLPIEVTVLNTHLNPPSSSVLTSLSMHRQVPGSGAVAPPRKPFALRNGSPASSAVIRVATACP